MIFFFFALSCKHLTAFQLEPNISALLEFLIFPVLIRENVVVRAAVLSALEIKMLSFSMAESSDGTGPGMSPSEGRSVLDVKGMKPD